MPALVASLLCLRSASQQAHLDAFFGNLCADGALWRGVSDRAFAKARSHLHAPALAWLNAGLVAQADAAGLLPRWQGLRLVAGDASVLHPAMRQCKRTHGLLSADARLFALYLPGAEMTLHAAVHSGAESERAMLAEALDALGPDDVLLLDRGYPAAWLVNLLNARGIRFVMRCDTATGGWKALRAFMRGQQAEATITLSRPLQRDVDAWGCTPEAPVVRVVRQTSPAGALRVLMTNLDASQVPAAAFGDLYHQRWRIEEAFKRLKCRAHLESVSGLSQQALLVDVAAKVLADNIAALMCRTAEAQAAVPADRQCQRSHAAAALQRVLPRLLLAVGDFVGLLDEALALIARTVRRVLRRRCAPRPDRHVKPHPSMAYRVGA